MSDADAAMSRLNRMIRDGLAPYLAMQVSSGAVPEKQAWRRQAQIDRSSELLTMAPAEWPELDVIWDLRPANFHLALDQTSAEEFADLFDAVGVYSVEVEELHPALLPGSRRVADPFSSAYRHKTSMLGAHLEAGGSVTPPLVRQLPEGLSIAGGNHRFGLARHRRQGRIPILVPQTEATSAQAKLTTLERWR